MSPKHIKKITGLASKRGLALHGWRIAALLIAAIIFIPSSTLLALDSETTTPRQIEDGVQGQSVFSSGYVNLAEQSGIVEQDISETVNASSPDAAERASALEESPVPPEGGVQAAESASKDLAAVLAENSAVNQPEDEARASESGEEEPLALTGSTLAAIVPPKGGDKSSGEDDDSAGSGPSDADAQAPAFTGVSTEDGTAPSGEARVSNTAAESLESFGEASGKEVNRPRRDVYCLEMIREDYGGNDIRFPTKLYVDSQTGEIYATDSGNKRILVYTHDFFPLLAIGKNDGVYAPAGVAVDVNGYVYVAQSKSREVLHPRISIFNPALIWERDIFFDKIPAGKGEFSPLSIAVSSTGRIYVAGRDYAGLVILDNEGNYLETISPLDSIGKMKLEKALVSDVEVDSNDRIYLLSEEMSRVYVYDKDEKFLFKFGEKGGGPGKLSRPRGMSLDEESGRVFLIDYMRHSGCAYSMVDGAFLFEFGGFGWSEGWFMFPTDIEVDNFGNVIVSDTFNNRVQVLNLE